MERCLASLFVRLSRTTEDKYEADRGSPPVDVVVEGIA
jgi:hypothetical protein